MYFHTLSFMIICCIYIDIYISYYYVDVILDNMAYRIINITFYNPFYWNDHYLYVMSSSTILNTNK